MEISMRLSRNSNLVLTGLLGAVFAACGGMNTDADVQDVVTPRPDIVGTDTVMPDTMVPGPDVRDVVQPGPDATDVVTDAPTPDVPRDVPGDTPSGDGGGGGTRNCREIHVAMPTAASGMFMIDPDGAGGMAPFSVYCDMTTDGGGWTVIFVPASSDQNSTTLDYTVPSQLLRDSATDVLLAYRNATMGVLPSWARFALPMAWRMGSPFRAVNTDVPMVMVSVEGAAAVSSTLRFGIAQWGEDCPSAWIPPTSMPPMPFELFGRICLQGTTGPFYSGFSDGIFGSDYCSLSNALYDMSECSATRMFSIAVR
jgi:hypothetical protein